MAPLKKKGKKTPAKKKKIAPKKVRSTKPQAPLVTEEADLNALPLKSNTRIIVVSDGTGETAAQMVKAAMVQFPQTQVYFTRYKNVRNETQIEGICRQANRHKDLVVFTIVSPELRSYLLSKAFELKVPCVDLLGPLLVGLGTYFGNKPVHLPGEFRGVNERYFRKIEAMEYTIAHDDGRELTGLEKADLIILGISRTSKTPLSMYLSHQGWKVANIPLIKDFELPAELFNIDQRRIIGLTIDAQELARIRRARLKRLGSNNGGEYADLDRVLDEVEYANDLFKKNKRWIVFNVTGKALEETASEIIKIMSSRGLIPENLLEGSSKPRGKIQSLIGDNR